MLYHKALFHFKVNSIFSIFLLILESPEFQITALSNCQHCMIINPSDFVRMTERKSSCEQNKCIIKPVEIFNNLQSFKAEKKIYYFIWKEIYEKLHLLIILTRYSYKCGRGKGSHTSMQTPTLQLSVDNIRNILFPHCPIWFQLEISGLWRRAIEKAVHQIFSFNSQYILTYYFMYIYCIPH